MIDIEQANGAIAVCQDCGPEAVLGYLGIGVHAPVDLDGMLLLSFDSYYRASIWAHGHTLAERHRVTTIPNEVVARLH